MDSLYRIGELAGLAGVSAKTIRFYEKVGVLPPPKRLTNGYRVYDDHDLARLRFVRGARALDLPLEAIKEAMRFRDRNEAPCLYVIELLKAKTHEIDRRIAELQALRAELKALNQAAEQLPTNDIEMKQCICQVITKQTTFTSS